MGVHRFFRLPPGVETLGDNGAFNYVDEPVPPVTVAETLDFYEECGFDAGVSTDHVIFGYEPEATAKTADPDWVERRKLTLAPCRGLHLARDAIDAARVEPVGAAQGWSPESYADSVRALQEMGYQRIALGGMVPLKTDQILACLTQISTVLQPGTELHLLGITRVDVDGRVRGPGRHQFRQHVSLPASVHGRPEELPHRERAYVAIRVPQVDGNPTLKRAILAGNVSQKEALTAEREALKALRAFDGTPAARQDCLDALGGIRSRVPEQEVVPRRLRGDSGGRALASLPLHDLQRPRRRDRHLPRDRAQQAPRLPQPVGPRHQDGATCPQRAAVTNFADANT